MSMMLVSSSSSLSSKMRIHSRDGSSFLRNSNITSSQTQSQSQSLFFRSHRRPTTLFSTASSSTTTTGTLLLEDAAGKNVLLLQNDNKQRQEGVMTTPPRRAVFSSGDTNHSLFRIGGGVGRGGSIRSKSSGSQRQRSSSAAAAAAARLPYGNNAVVATAAGAVPQMKWGTSFDFSCCIPTSSKKATKNDHHRHAQLRKVPAAEDVVASLLSSSLIPSSPWVTSYWLEPATATLLSSTRQLSSGRLNSIESSAFNFPSSVVVAGPVPANVIVRNKTIFFGGGPAMVQEGTTAPSLTTESISQSSSPLLSSLSSLSRVSSMSSSPSLGTSTISILSPYYFRHVPGVAARNTMDSRKYFSTLSAISPSYWSSSSSSSSSSKVEEFRWSTSCWPSSLSRMIYFSTKRTTSKNDTDRKNATGFNNTNVPINRLRKELNQLRQRRPSSLNATDAVKVFKHMVGSESRKQNQVNVRDCNKVISAIGKSGHRQAPQMALSVLNDMGDLYKRGNKAIRPNVFTYTSVINAYARRGNVDGALKVFKMQVDDFKQSNNTRAQPNIFTYNTMMNAWVKSGRVYAVDAVEKLFLGVKKLSENGELDEGPSVVTFNTLIDCWSKSGRKESTAKALHYLNGMKAMGIDPDVMSYNSAMDAHAKQGDLDGAMRVFELMKGAVTPVIQSYNILMDAWAKSGRSDAPAEAMKLLMTIKDLHAAGEIDSPNVITFTTAMDAHAKQGDVNGALKVFEMMEGEFKPNMRSYNILLDAFAKSGRSEAPGEAMALLMTIKDLHAAGKIDAPTIITYNTSLDACAKQGDVDGAMRVFKMMQDEVKPNMRSYNILIDVWAKSGRSDAPAEAMKLLMTIKDLHAAGKIDTPTIITYNTSFDAHAKQGEVDGAMKVFEMMSRGEVKPNLLSYSILIDVWAKSGRSEAPTEAMKLLMTIKDLHAAGEIDAPDIITYNTALDAHAKQGEVDGAMRVFKMMQDELKLNRHSYKILKYACSKSGRADAPDLLKKIKTMHGRGELYKPPSASTFGELVNLSLQLFKPLQPCMNAGIYLIGMTRKLLKGKLNSKTK